MNTGMKLSYHRLWIGMALSVLAILIAVFLLPDASGRAAKERRSAEDAQINLERQQSILAEHQSMLDRIHEGRQNIAELEEHMPKGDIGILQASLRSTLYKLADENSVKLASINFRAASSDGSRNTGIESIDVEFTAFGVYQNIKAFMLALESSGQPFGAPSVKLEESPEGGRLNVTLRAFRQASAPALASSYEGVP